MKKFKHLIKIKLIVESVNFFRGLKNFLTHITDYNKYT